MLSQLYRLDRQADGRYATDSELQFLAEYLQSYTVRLSAYCKLQSAEAQIMEQLQERLKQLDPQPLVWNDPGLQEKCQRDILFVLRYSAIALLLSDTELLQERVLFWLQTIMRSFKDHQRRCNLTYQVMQEVVRGHLTPSEADLFCPILELNRRFLGFA